MVPVSMVVRAGLVSAAIGALLVLVGAVAAPLPDAGSTEGGYVRAYRPPRSALEVMLNRGDGQAYATLAQDPALRDPSAFVGGPPVAAFFAHRPLLPYLAWAGSAGRPDAVPYALAVLAVLAVGLLGSACTLLAETLWPGRLGWWAIAPVVLPGVLSDATTFDPGTLATALVVFGLARWLRRGADGIVGTATLFTFAVLAREVAIVVPVAIVLVGAWQRTLRAREVALVAPAAVAYVGWFAVVTAGYGDTGRTMAQYGAFALPGTGLVAASATWELADLVLAAVSAVLVVASIVWAPSLVLRATISAYAVASVVLNEIIWRSWLDFERVLLPMFTLSLLVVTAHLLERRLPAGASAGAAAPGPG